MTYAVSVTVWVKLRVSTISETEGNNLRSTTASTLALTTASACTGSCCRAGACTLTGTLSGTLARTLPCSLSSALSSTLTSTLTSTLSGALACALTVTLSSSDIATGSGPRGDSYDHAAERLSDGNTSGDGDAALNDRTDDGSCGDLSAGVGPTDGPSDSSGNHNGCECCQVSMIPTA